VYRLRTKPALREYGNTLARKQVSDHAGRGACRELSVEMLVLIGEPPTDPDPWTIRRGPVGVDSPDPQTASFTSGGPQENKWGLGQGSGTGN